MKTRNEFYDLRTVIEIARGFQYLRRHCTKLPLLQFIQFL